MGISSKQVAIPKFQSTCANFKSLLCRTVEHHGIILDAIPSRVNPVNLNSPRSDLYATVTVKNASNQDVTLTIQQVLAAYLTKIFSIAKEVCFKSFSINSLTICHILGYWHPCRRMSLSCTLLLDCC